MQFINQTNDVVTYELPELPDGYFWRMTPFMSSDVMLELRKERFMGSYMVDNFLMLYRGSINPSQEDVDYAAQFLYVHLERSLNKPTCYGDYHACNN